MEIYNILRTLLGSPPEGYEFLEYIMSALIAIWFIKQVFNLIELPIKMITSRKGGD